MSSPPLELEEIRTGQPDSAGGGRRRPWLPRHRGGDAAERAGLRWAVLAWVVVLVLLLVQDPGRMTFDTKLGVDIDPVGFYERLWHLWNPLEYLGGLQDQYIGYAFPMGAFYLIAHLLHMPVWVAGRLWMSLLAAVGFLGLVRLAEAAGIGTRCTRLVAGAAFALWPTFTILIGSYSGGVLPGVLAPWAVVPLIRTGPARTAAARSGLAVACMGGINAVSTLAALVLPGMYILTRPGRRRRALAGWWVAAVLLATAWWAGPLLYQGRYGFNFLPYIEQAATTTRTMSAAAVLRGSGNWVAYLNFGQPWLTAGSVLTGTGWAIAAATLAAAAGLAGLARRDLPEALWLRCTAGVAALCALAGYGGPLGGPLHQPVQALLDGALSALRNVFKIEPVLAAVLALGIAHMLARAVWPRPAGRLASGVARGVVAAGVLAGLGLPYLSGLALQPGSFTQVPAYWQQAAGWLAAHNGTQTTLVVPADSHGIYTWGQPIDEPLEPLARSPWVQRNLVPFSGGGVNDLLDGAEQAIEAGAASPGLAGYLARAGIRYVLVRNDLDPAQLGYTPPEVVHAALRASGFTRIASFGQPVQTGPVGQGTALQVEAIEPEYPPVEVFQAADPAARPAGPAAVLPADSTTLVDGGPAALLQLADQGLLNSGQPAVIAGQDTAADPPASRQDVTDGLRRADTAFGLPDDNTSYTYSPSGTIPPDNPQGAGGRPPRQLLPAGTAGHKTVAVLTGAASVTASSAGSWLWEVPQADPAGAFDGNPATAWTEASPVSAAGQWIQVNFPSPRDLSGPATIRLLDDISRPVATRLIVTTAAGRAVTATGVTPAAQPLRIPPGTTGWLRITIAAARGGVPGGPGAGISDVVIPGVRVTSYLEPAQDQAGPAPSFSFHRDTGTTLGLPGNPPEADLNRTFTTPGAESFRVSATVTAVPGAALDTLLDRLGSATSAQLRISATSTFGSLPALRPQNLLDGTGWIAAGPAATVHLSWTGRRTIDEIRLIAETVGIAAQPTRVLITSPDGTRDMAVPPTGILSFPPLTTDRLDISFPGVEPATAYNPLTGRSEQLPVGLGALSIPALAGLRTGIPAATTPFRLACGQGPPLTMDGRTYPTSVSGTVRDLISSTPLPLRVCTSGSVLALPAGRHWLSSPGTGLPLAITDLSLANGAAVPAPGPAASRGLRVGTWGAEHRTMAIGPGGLSYLEVHQAASPGWTATLNGHRLTPVTLDGWQQAFVVPAGAGGTVVMTFTPAAGYHWLLAGSVLALCVLIAAAACPPRRGGVRGPLPPSIGGGGPQAPDSGAAVPTPGPALYWLAPAAGPGVGTVGAALVLALTGGLVAIAVPAVVLLGWWRRQWVPWLAFAAMCVAGVLVIAGLSHDAQPGSGSFGWGPFGWPAQAAALVALAAVLVPPVPPVPWPWRSRAAGPGRAGPASWPLTPIEELDLYLESAADPGLIQLELLVGGHLDAAVLQAALAGVLAADPAARRHLAAISRWHRRLRWDAGAPGHDDGMLAVASWRSPGQLAALREWVSAWPIPPSDRAVRLVLAAGPERDVVILQTHHAAFDGISSLALLTAIGAAYRERAGDLAGSGPKAVPALAPRPFGAVGPASPRGADRIPRARIWIPAWISGRIPGAVTRIAAHSARPDQPGYGYVQRSLPVPRPAREGDGPYPTVNDLLVAALIGTVDRWNTAHGRRGGRIRVSVPVNDRGHQNRSADPGNKTRLIRVTARRRERAESGRLLAHVAAQTRAAKERPTAGLDAMSRLLATAWAPAVVKRLVVRLARRVAAPLCTDTALLSNLGAIPCPPCFNGGGAEPLWFSGPARMPRGLGVGALTIAGQLHLCVHYRHALLDRDAAAHFTALYCEALGELTGSSP